MDEDLRVLQHQTFSKGKHHISPSHLGRTYSRRLLSPNELSQLRGMVSHVMPVLSLKSPENWLTDIDVTYGYHPLQLKLCLQLSTLVLRTAEPRSLVTVWVQQVLHRILGILHERGWQELGGFWTPEGRKATLEHRHLQSLLLRLLNTRERHQGHHATQPVSRAVDTTYFCLT